LEKLSIIIADLESHLFRLLDMLPKIPSIVFSHSFKTDHPEKYKLALAISHARIRPFQLRALFRAISRSNSLVTSIEHENGSLWFDEGSGVGSEVVYVRYWKEKQPVIVSSAFELDPEELSITKSIFSNLTHLNIALYSDVCRYLPHASPSEPHWASLGKAHK